MGPLPGTIRCNNACIVRGGPALDSEWICELKPGTQVKVVGEVNANSRRRLQLSEPCEGWVTGKYVEMAPGALVSQASGTWTPKGQQTLFPQGQDQKLSKKTPMGRQLELFAGDGSVDKSFGSIAAMITDRSEMMLWLMRELKRFNSGLGEDARACLMGDLVNAQQQLQAERTSLSDQVARPSGASPGRLKVIFLAGVEGTGHHGFMPMLLYAAVREFGAGVLAWWRSLREVLLKTPPSERRAKLRKLLTSMQASAGQEPRIIFEWCSYPFGEEHRDRWASGCADPTALLREESSGNPGNSVDLREFVELFKEYADVKVLVLQRGLVASSWSHKEWDQSLLHHSRVLALFNEYLTGVLQGLDPSTWRWVAYEDVCTAHRHGAFGNVASTLGAFLGLPAAPLQRAFERFRPSTKDAAQEMSAAAFAEVRALEEHNAGRWFPALFPEQQLLGEMAQRANVREPLQPSSRPGMEAEQVAAHQMFAQLAEQLNDKQKQVWLEMQSGGEEASAAEKAQRVQKLQETLSEDQLFLLRKALIHQKSSQTAQGMDVDPTAYTCLHMWLGGCGFGSEVNNLLSAAIFCSQHGLDCVVQDEQWNSGRLHDYVRAEPLILRRCQHAGRCRTLEVKRDRRAASVGWFVICKHAKGVQFEMKSEFAQKVLRYTPGTERKVLELNRELRLPSSYVAVQIRRGDKVAGRRRESLKVKMSDYVQAAVSQCLGPASCTTVVVCSDDVSAAEELCDEIARTSPRLTVRWRARVAAPNELRTGHWQEAWNSLPDQERRALTHEFLADLEVMRTARALICTHSSNVGRLAALVRSGPTISLDSEWTND